EGDSGFTDMPFELKLSAVSGKTVTVRCNEFGFSAQPNFDFLPLFNPLITFAPGETSKTLTVRVIGETIVEPNETFRITLNLPTNVTLADSTALGTIIDDDSLLLLTEEGNQRALSLD